MRWTFAFVVGLVGLPITGAHAQPLSPFAIAKATTLAHVEENADAAAVELEADEVGRISAAFPLGPWRGGVPVR